LTGTEPWSYPSKVLQNWIM